jgi:hypothetical protein
MRYLSLLVLMSCFLALESIAQPQLVLDTYGMKRTYVKVGDTLHFKLRKDKFIHHDLIADMRDSTIFLVYARTTVHLKDIETFYFPKYWSKLARFGLTSMGTMLLLSSFGTLTTSPNGVSGAGYTAGDYLKAGTGTIATGQVFRFIRWRKFKIHEKSRVRILDL